MKNESTKYPHIERSLSLLDWLLGLLFRLVRLGLWLLGILLVVALVMALM